MYPLSSTEFGINCSTTKRITRDQNFYEVGCLTMQVSHTIPGIKIKMLLSKIAAKSRKKIK